MYDFLDDQKRLPNRVGPRLKIETATAPRMIVGNDPFHVSDQFGVLRLTEFLNEPPPQSFTCDRQLGCRLRKIGVNLIIRHIIIRMKLNEFITPQRALALPYLFLRDTSLKQFGQERIGVPDETRSAFLFV